MPKEYIEREAAIRCFKEHMTKTAQVGNKPMKAVYLMAKDHAIDYLNVIPAADVVEVVRCKDCKHKGNDDVCPMIKIRMCNDGDGYFDEVSEDETFNDGFCSYGERKEEN